MINYVTGNEYSGSNANTLMALGFGEGDAFVTFKQAIKLDGISGKSLKGLKKSASLIRFSKELDKDTGTWEKKPRYFSVFHIDAVLSRRAA